jgi:hypothetical protein
LEGVRRRKMSRKEGFASPSGGDRRRPGLVSTRRSRRRGRSEDQARPARSDSGRCRPGLPGCSRPGADDSGQFSAATDFPGHPIAIGSRVRYTNLKVPRGFRGRHEEKDPSG